MVSRDRGVQRGLCGIKYVDGNETYQSRQVTAAD
jgi:hypothetical protein